MTSRQATRGQAPTCFPIPGESPLRADSLSRPVVGAEIACPSCGHRFELNAALAAQLRSEVEEAVSWELEARVREARTQAEQATQEKLAQELRSLQAALAAQAKRASETEARELALKQQAIELEEAQRRLVERVRLETEAQVRREAEARTAQLVAEATQRARDTAALDLEAARSEIIRQRTALAQAHAAELDLRTKAEALEARARGIELEIARRLEGERLQWESQARQRASEEHALKLRERDKQIEDMRRVIEDLKRKSEQGSQQLQGEVLELDIEAALAVRFPHDIVRPVAKGTLGADLLHEVRDASLAKCGAIVWETKNTKHWQPAWIAKLKDDQRACGAALAVLVTAALPPEARAGFVCIDGVWVASLAAWPALAVVLREQLLQVAFARGAATGMNEKMEALYRYLAGEAFRHKVESIVEGFTAMKSELDRERRAMTRIWKERERQIERVIDATTAMYGELRGTIGSRMPAIASLELGDAPDLAALPHTLA